MRRHRAEGGFVAGFHDRDRGRGDAAVPQGRGSLLGSDEADIGIGLADAIDRFDAGVIAVVVREHDVVRAQRLLHQRRSSVDVGGGGALARIVGIDLHDRAGGVFDGEGALSEPVDADAAIGDDEVFEGMHG